MTFLDLASEDQENLPAGPEDPDFSQQVQGRPFYNKVHMIRVVFILF